MKDGAGTSRAQFVAIWVNRPGDETSPPLHELALPFTRAVAKRVVLVLMGSDLE